MHSQTELSAASHGRRASRSAIRRVYLGDISTAPLTVLPQKTEDRDITACMAWRAVRTHSRIELQSDGTPTVDIVKHHVKTKVFRNAHIPLCERHQVGGDCKSAPDSLSN